MRTLAPPPFVAAPPGRWHMVTCYNENFDIIKMHHMIYQSAHFMHIPKIKGVCSILFSIYEYMPFKN